jgi:hydroxypyruvate isomerase
MKKSANIEVLYTEQPWAERFALAKRDGFDYVEFWGWEGKDLREVKNLLDKNNLKFSAMSGDGPLSMCDPMNKRDYIAYIKRSLEMAQIITCPNLVIHSDSLEDSPQYAKPLSGNYTFVTKVLAMYDVLKEIVPLAEKAGIVFVLEAINTIKDHCGSFLDNTELSADLVRAIGSPNLKILYDAYHMYLNEGKICETIEKYLAVIGYIHIADAPGRGEPGTGAINYRNVFKYINNIGYSDVVGFELYPLNGSIEAIKAIKDATKEV